MWQGGATTELDVQLARTGETTRVADDAVVEDVRTMARSMTDQQIAGTIVRRGVRTATGLPYNAARVDGLRRRHGISVYQPQPAADGEPVYTAEEATGGGDGGEGAPQRPSDQRRFKRLQHVATPV